MISEIDFLHKQPTKPSRRPTEKIMGKFGNITPSSEPDLDSTIGLVFDQ